MAHSILLIDDEKVFLVSIATYLRKKGFEIFKAENGLEGLSMAIQKLPDIIITDWDMPHLSGIELVKKLQANPSTQDIPVIVSSGILITIKDLETAFEAGAVDFVRKPIEKIELLARINSSLRLSNSYKQLKEEKRQLEFANTELKRLQNQLIHHEKMNSLGQLTSSVAHEINNPLNFVLGGAEAISLVITDLQAMLQRLAAFNTERSSPEELSQAVKNIQQELAENNAFRELSLLSADIKEGGHRIMQIVHGLSAFAQIKNTGIVMGDIHEGLNTILMLLTNQFQDRIEVQKQFDSSIPQFEADHGSLNQVFLNILTNSVQAIPNRGKLVIRTRRRDNQIEVAIEDTGVGMPPHLLEKIFMPFFSTDDTQKGLGIGLSVSHTIMKAQGGDITCTSTEGEGTKFVVIFPFTPITKAQKIA